ncbi:MAG: HIT family protein [Deltaproteobacteria bacterium]|nr:HIT family protein [Deltaproteobacteria bacterium]
MPRCVFCAIASGETAAEIIEETEHTVAFLDTRPLFPGHVLVVPRAHHVTLGELPTPLLPELFGAAQRVAVAVEEAMGAEGTFVAMNNRVSQSVPHLHVHVVPRTKGDGLRGFFWPRHAYASDEERRQVAERIRAAL